MQPEIPQLFMDEILDGKPVYYRADKNQQIIDKLRLCSTLQAHINYYFTRIMIKSSLDDDFFIHTSYSNSFECEIVVFDKKVLQQVVNLNNAQIPPTIVFEINMRANLSEITELADFRHKTQKLLNFGVQKVFWVLPLVQKIIVATSNETWRILSWNKDIEILNQVTFNVGQYLHQQGIQIQV